MNAAIVIASPSPSWSLAAIAVVFAGLRRRDTERAVGSPVPRDQRAATKARQRPRRRAVDARRPPAARSSWPPPSSARDAAASSSPAGPSAPVAVRPARPRGPRRHPPAVPQPRHRRRLRASASPASAPPCIAFLWPQRQRRLRLEDHASARSTTSRPDHRRGQRLRLLPRGPHVDHRVPGRGARQGRSRSTRRPSWPAWRPGSSRSTRSACTSAAACRSASRRSGSSARATARSTTRSVRRRAARRRVASTASP